MSLGIGLPDYSNPVEAAAAAANDARLASDPAFIAAEQARAAAVIIAREAAGLDTSAQRNYLDRLDDLAGGGNWVESGQTAQAVAVAASVPTIAAPKPTTTQPTTTHTHQSQTAPAAQVSQVPFGASALLPGFQMPLTVAAETAAAPDYGKGLPDYTNPAEAAAGAANDARLVSDPAFVAAEITRTKAVIAAREAAGMETAGQEFYLDRLYDLRDGGNWYESGQTPEAYEVAAKYGPAGQPDQFAIVNPPIKAAGFLGLPWWAWVAAGVVALTFGRKPSKE